MRETVYFLEAPALEGVAEELYHCGFEGVNLTFTSDIKEALTGASYIVSSGGAARKAGMTREDFVASVACASGMAAITNALLNIVGSGDEIITSTSLYGGTIDLYHDLEAFGITTIFADTNDLEDLESKITDKTRVIFAETIGNPKLDVTDIPALAGIAKRHNLPLNTAMKRSVIVPMHSSIKWKHSTLTRMYHSLI